MISRQQFRTASLAASMLLSACVAFAQSSLVLPSFTSYAEPDPASLPIPESSPLTGWHDPSTRLVWYGQILSTGKLTGALRLRLPQGQQARFGLTINGTLLPEQTVTGTGSLQTVPFGSVEIGTPQPVRLQLRGIQTSGKSFGDIDGLEMTGPAVKNALFNLTPQRGAPSVHLNYLVPPNVDAEWFYGEVTAKADPLWTYYEVCGFARGYFGMQVNSASERRIIFSVWDSGNEPLDRTKVPDDDRVQLLGKGDGVVAESFGNEGTGGHSHLVYSWKTGDTYRFLVHSEPMGQRTIYSGYFFFPERNAWGLIARFSAPKDGHYLSHLYSFDEDFDGANGQMQRLAQFGNEWVRTTQGQWIELTEARFTHTARGLYKDRIDRAAGVIGDRFFLTGGGFEPSNMRYNDIVTRPPSHTAPELTLPIENYKK